MSQNSSTTHPILRRSERLQVKQVSKATAILVASEVVVGTKNKAKRDTTRPKKSVQTIEKFPPGIWTSSWIIRENPASIRTRKRLVPGSVRTMLIISKKKSSLRTEKRFVPGIFKKTLIIGKNSSFLRHGKRFVPDPNPSDSPSKGKKKGKKGR